MMKKFTEIELEEDPFGNISFNIFSSNYSTEMLFFWNILSRNYLYSFWLRIEVDENWWFSN